MSLQDYSVVNVTEKDGAMVPLSFPDRLVHAHLRPGHLIPIQYDVYVRMMSTVDLVQNNYTVIINRDE